MITRLSARSRVKGRVDVYEDDQYAFTADAAGLRDAGVNEGCMRDAQEIYDSLLVSERASALERSYRFLETRMRAEKEVRDKLLAAGYSRQLVDETLDRLSTLGFVNDQEFAVGWAASRLKGKSLGAVRRELRFKGVDGETIDQALAEIVPEEDSEVEKCMAVARRYFGRGDDIQTVRRKAAQACARRGFGWDDIQSALAHLESEIQD